MITNASFLREADELLNAINDHILSLEKHPDDKENVDHVFRAAHTLKGSANLYDYSGISILTHLLESILDDIRSGTRKADAPLVDVLLESFDQVRLLTERIRDGEDDPQSEPELLHRLGRFQAVVREEAGRLAFVAEAASPTEQIETARKFAEGKKDPETFVHLLPKLAATEPETKKALNRPQAKQVKAAAVMLEQAVEGEYGDEQTAGQLGGAAEKLVRLAEKEPDTSCSVLLLQFAIACTLIETYARCEGSDKLRPYWWDDVCAAIRDGLESWLSGTAPVRFYDTVLDIWDLVKPGAAPKQEFGTLLAPPLLEDAGTIDAEDTTYRLAGGRESAYPDAMSPSVDASPAGAFPFADGGADAAEIEELAKQLIVEQMHFLAPKGRPLIERWELARDILWRCALAIDDRELRALAEMTAPEMSALKRIANRYVDSPAGAGRAEPQVPKRLAAPALSETASIEAAPAAPAAGISPAAPAALADHADQAAPASPFAAASLAPSAPQAAAAGESEQIIRVETGKIERLMELVGELAVARNAFPFMIGKLQARQEDAVSAAELKEKYAILDRITRDLQDAIFDIRMLPVSHVFSKFHRFVRDMARQSGKSIRLMFEGEDTTLDKTLVEAISDPLIHLIRNAIDHGLEPADARRRAGKTEEGLLRIGASREGNRVVMEVFDDGAGIDADRIRAKLAETGELAPARLAEMSEAELVQTIFQPGFTTATEVSPLSGRGFGMDAVKRMVQRLHGDVIIRSERGLGTTIRIELPLTLSMTHILQVSAGGGAYGIPLEQIEETLRVRSGDIRTMQGRPVIVLRDSVYPVVDLRQFLSLPAGGEEEGSYVVVLGSGVAVRVDALDGQQEVVVKPPEACFKHLAYLSGASILGNGTVLLILNANEIRPSEETRLDAAAQPAV